jgi:hypothetical protein
MKLNQREQTILKAMQEGERCIYMPYRGRLNPHAYFTIGHIGKCTREINKLIKLGLVIHENVGYNRDNVVLTPEGKSFQLDLEEPYDVWVVNSNWCVKVEKYSGFLKEHTLLMANGSSVKKGKDREFFLDRAKAFEYAIGLQERHVYSAKGKVEMAEKALEGIQKHMENPEEDAARYL